MIRYIIAPTEEYARAAYVMYDSLEESDRAAYERAQPTEEEAHEVLAVMRTDPDRDPADRDWALSCKVWRHSYDCISLPEK